MQNIHTNNVRSLDLKNITDEYYDFMLYKGEVSGLWDLSQCLAADISAYSLGADGKLHSSAVWAEAVNDGISLKDIGFVGVDNGFIYFDKDNVSRDEFWKIFTGSTYDIDEENKEFFLSPITGNTKEYIYPYSFETEDGEKYIALKGGFFQGFYKMEGFNYQTLPNEILNGWCMNFVVRRRSDYEVEDGTLNKEHPDNNGIFFFMGARAENKFWPYYRHDKDKMNQYKEEYCEFLVHETQDTKCGDYALDDAYWTDGNAEGDCNDFDTSDGIPVGEQGYFEMETDNKFVFFNCTPTGFTTHNWVEGTTVLLTGVHRPNINLFPLMNCTPTGYTVHTYQQLLEDYGTEENGAYYNILDDLRGNAIAFRVREDGSLGYKMAVTNCDLEDKYEAIEAYSKPNIIPYDEWVNITVQFVVVPEVDKCEAKRRKNRVMRLYFYVNGALVFISKELPIPNFRALDDAYQKQEGVPYNISLGGGTQGLAEVIYPDYGTLHYLLPMERDFGGTFLGDIKSFRFFDCPLNYNTILTL